MQVKEAILGWLGPVLYEFYGSTELGINTVLKPHDMLSRPGSCGKPVPGVEIRIFDPRTKKDAPPGGEGLIYVKKNAVMIDEYHKDEGKTKELFSLVGWATVGDIGRVDEDGFLYICDRSTDMIISGGVNIYPKEIEDVLHRMPEVVDCAVFGVPDSHWGERVHASLVLKDDVRLTEADVIDFCRQRMSDFKIPREVSFHKPAEFPRDAAGKILKRVLREPYWRKQGARI